MPPPARVRNPAAPKPETSPGSAGRRWRRRTLIGLLCGATLGVLLVGGAIGWTWVASADHRYRPDDAPAAPVVIVFGAKLAPGGKDPKPFLAGRLDVAAALFRSGRAGTVLVSGDARGDSGNEVAAMTRYLVARGVPAERIVADGHGLDTYDTCARAGTVYRVRRALLVSQSFHLPRAITLCRALGIDADGVDARCDGCRQVTLWKNAAREAGADLKAVLDLAEHRPPVVTSAG